MKTVIRHGVFETNSSSCHAISIGKGNLVDLAASKKDSIVHISSGEFGWGPEAFYYWKDRASYALTYALDEPELQERLEKVIKDYTQAADVILHCHPHDYIDHESRAEAGDIFETDETLRDFIFSDNSILVIDNDNH